MLVRRRYKSLNSICRGDTLTLISWVLPQTNHRPAQTKFRDFQQRVQQKAMLYRRNSIDK